MLYYIEFQILVNIRYQIYGTIFSKMFVHNTLVHKHCTRYGSIYLVPYVGHHKCYRIIIWSKCFTKDDTIFCIIYDQYVGTIVGTTLVIGATDAPPSKHSDCLFLGVLTKAERTSCEIALHTLNVCVPLLNRL